MDSFTKHIINTPNVSRPRFKKSSKPESRYIYQYPLFDASVLFFKCAGGVGERIFAYLFWKESMNGRKFETLPNKLFHLEWGIPRQRIYDALNKLEHEKLIVLNKEPGLKTRVRLNTPQGRSNDSTK